MHTSFRGAEVFARGRSARTSAASLLNAQSSAFDDFVLKTFSRSFSLVRGDHLHKAESARFLGVRIAHDLALFDVAVFLEHLGDLVLAQAGVNAGNEEVGSRVHGSIVVIVFGTRWTARSTGNQS